MRYIVANCIAGAALFALLGKVSMAGDAPPRIVQEPVLGLRYDIAKTKFDILPADVLALCTTINAANAADHLWVFAFAHDAARSYYVVGGYGVRLHPEPPDFPKFTSYDYGDVFMLEGVQCKRLGSVRELFDDGPYDDLPQAILQQLALDLALRLARGFGGPENLQTELRNQRVDFDRFTPELRIAFKSYAGQ